MRRCSKWPKVAHQKRKLPLIFWRWPPLNVVGGELPSPSGFFQCKWSVRSTGLAGPTQADNGLLKIPTILNNQKSRLGERWVRWTKWGASSSFGWDFREIDTTYCGIFHETWRQGTRAVGEMGAKSHPRASIRREFWLNRRYAKECEE